MSGAERLTCSDMAGSRSQAALLENKRELKKRCYGKNRLRVLVFVWMRDHVDEVKYSSQVDELDEGDGVRERWTTHTAPVSDNPNPLQAGACALLQHFNSIRRTLALLLKSSFCRLLTAQRAYLAERRLSRRCTQVGKELFDAHAEIEVAR